MKDLIIQALSQSFTLLEKQVPQTKAKEVTSSSIHDVKPTELLSFMVNYPPTPKAMIGLLRTTYENN